ncbi:uncharacterized protein LOC131481270 [Ochotona princeps]|uniref:uncharacterized protein LOC131481270 n=1 Tax=Ochotona princeps TaxID=9978 RepID=UPI0027155F9D|nr:uncharacterized protein LOC131481270 [Ochotona princeps]
MVPSIEKIQDHLKMFNQKYSKFKNVVLHQARLTKKQEILLKRISANLTHVHQQHDGLEKKQSEIEALLRDVGQFYLQFRNESQDARNSLDEFHRKLQESETVHLEKLQYAEKSLDDLEHCASRLRCESLKLQSNLRLCADSIEELQRILADVKYLQEQYDNLKQRQSGSEASPEDVEGFYHRLKQKTREIMEKLGTDELKCFYTY